LPESLCGCEALAWLEEGNITLGRFRTKLEDAQASMHGPLLDYFSLLAELAGPETRKALAGLSRRVRVDATQPRAADWQPMLDALGREHVGNGVTEDTTLRELSGVLWREHTRQD
jgi:hypothetical protein